MTRTRDRRRCLSRCLIGIVAVAGALIALPPASRAVPEEPAPAPVELKIGVFNIEYGGAHVSFDKVVRAIQRGGADVVGVEEAQTHIPRLARALGWPYFSVRLQVVSKYPLIDPPGGDGVYLFVEVEPGRVVAIENVHLPSNPYGPFRVRKGEPRSHVLALERRLRLPAIRPSLRAAKRLLAQGIPMFMTGDFNAPSWRDWTSEMVGVRPQIRYPVRWPVSLAVERAGFVDSYRAVHPDPLTDPGLTWWAARPELPGWNPAKKAPQDRIDLVYAAGAAVATDSIVEGERDSPLADVGVQPWPSDHRSVVSTFAVTPAVPPDLVAVDRRLVDIGTDVRVRFHAPGSAGERVAIVPAGAEVTTDAIADQPTGRLVDGELSFTTEGWSAGAYEAVLVSGSEEELSRVAFWLKEPEAGPEISTGKRAYAVGAPIEVSWRNAPGERWDWVGIYKRGRDPHVAWYLLWDYTHASIAGSLTLDGSANGTWPLGPGRYSIYLLADDGYKLLAAAPFRVKG